MTLPQSRSLPLEANEEMIEAARSLRVNLRFGNTGISGSLSAWEISELWRLMVTVAPDGTTPSETAANNADGLFPLLWHINDHLTITPDQAVEYTGSTNDVDRLRDMLHKLDPHFTRGVKG